MQPAPVVLVVAEPRAPAQHGGPHQDHHDPEHPHDGGDVHGARAAPLDRELEADMGVRQAPGRRTRSTSSSFSTTVNTINVSPGRTTESPVAMETDSS